MHVHNAVCVVCKVGTCSLRLCCYDDFCEMIQRPFSTLLPPEPLTVFKYAPDEDEFGMPLHAFYSRNKDTSINKHVWCMFFLIIH